MDASIITGARQLQLIFMAVLMVMVLIVGLRIAGQGPKGFASGLLEAAGLFFAGWVILRPNDAFHMLSSAIGGVQTPAMPAVIALFFHL